MKYLLFIPWLLAVNGIILLTATMHLRRFSGKWGRIVSSTLLLVLTSAVVGAFGFHHCDEGTAPSVVVFGTAILSAAVPWAVPSHLSVLRGGVAAIVSCGILAASYLTSSYHRPDVTGNPLYSSGRFWHTAFTGQYPRDLTTAPGFRRQETHENEPPSND